MPLTCYGVDSHITVFMCLRTCVLAHAFGNLDYSSGTSPFVSSNYNIYKSIVILFCLWLSCFLYILTFAAILWYTERGTHTQTNLNGDCLNEWDEGSRSGVEKTQANSLYLLLV